MLYECNKNNCLHITGCKSHHIVKWAWILVVIALVFLQAKSSWVCKFCMVLIFAWDHTISGTVSVSQSIKFWMYSKQQMFVFPFEHECATFLFSSLKKPFKLLRVWFSSAEDNCSSFRVFTSSGPKLLENFYYFRSFSNHHLLCVTCRYFQ